MITILCVARKFLINRFVYAVSLSTLFFWLALYSPVGMAKDSYVFVLQGLNSPFDATVLERNYVDGLALQIGWRDIEPVQGKFDWQRVDKIVELVKNKNKRVTLHLLPLRPPEWIFKAGVERHCFTMPARGEFLQSRSMCEALPWDDVYLQLWSSLVTAFGKHYSNHPTLLAVSITAPSPEMVLPGAIPGTPTFSDMQKRYDKNVYLRAWKQMIDKYQDAFPDKKKFLAPGMVLFDENFADDVILYAEQRFGKNLWLFNAGLRSDGVPQKTMATGHIASVLEKFSTRGVLGLQTIWNASNDPGNRMRGPLRDVLAAGRKMGASYFEIYAVDVLNPALQTDLVNFKRELCRCDI